jgi:hypothetical protein
VILLSAGFEEGFKENGLINPRPEKNCNVYVRSQERSIKRHDLAVCAVNCKVAGLDSPRSGAQINCKDYAVSSLCKSWNRTKHK